jgi:hypothetical protein
VDHGTWTRPCGTTDTPYRTSPLGLAIVLTSTNLLTKMIRSLYDDLLVKYYSCFGIVVERGLIGDDGLNHRKLPRLFHRILIHEVFSHAAESHSPLLLHQTAMSHHSLGRLPHPRPILLFLLSLHQFSKKTPDPASLVQLQQPWPLRRRDPAHRQRSDQFPAPRILSCPVPSVFGS